MEAVAVRGGGERAAVPYGECAELRYRVHATSPLELLRGDKVVRICAPMVRYSK